MSSSFANFGKSGFANAKLVHTPTIVSDSKIGSAFGVTKRSENHKPSARRSIGFGFGRGLLNPKQGPLGNGPSRSANKTTAKHVASVNSTFDDEDVENQENSMPAFSFSSNSVKTPANASVPRLRRSKSTPLSVSSVSNVRSDSTAKKQKQKNGNSLQRSSSRKRAMTESDIVAAVVSPAVSDNASVVSSASPFDRSIHSKNGGASSAAKSDFSVGTAVDSVASSPSVAEDEENDEEDLDEFQDTEGGPEEEEVERQAYSSSVALPSPSDSQAFLETEEARAVDSPASDEGAADSDVESESESEIESSREEEEEDGVVVRQSLVASVISVSSPPAEEVIVIPMPRDSVRRASQTPVPTPVVTSSLLSNLAIQGSNNDSAVSNVIANTNNENENENENDVSIGSHMSGLSALYNISAVNLDGSRRESTGENEVDAKVASTPIVATAAAAAGKDHIVNAAAEVVSSPCARRSCVNGGGGGAVRVMLRIRPFTMREMEEREEETKPENSVFSFPDAKNQPATVVARPSLAGIGDGGGGKVKSAMRTKTFTFEHVFNETMGQRAVYNGTAAPLVAQCLRRRNCAVIAYGGSGAGKVRKARSSSVSTFIFIPALLSNSISVLICVRACVRA